MPSRDRLAPMRRRPTAARDAFMLLEVVIAVGIFAFAMVGLAETMNRLIDVELASREDQRVRLEIQSRLAEARLANIETGEIDMGEDAFGVRYIREYEEIEFLNQYDEPLDGIFTLTITALEDGEPVQSAEVLVNANARF